MSTQYAASFATRDDAPRFWVMGDELRAMGSLAGTTWHVMDVAVPPGSGTPPHRHASPEIFMVTEGHVSFGVAESGAFRTFTAKPGDVVTVPSGVPHLYRNETSGPARFTVLVDAGMKAFFDAVASPAPPPPGPPSAEQMAEIMAACAAHGIEILDAT